jgi:hypothetical protein
MLAVVLRPRFERMPKHTLDRSAAPGLYALMERVCAELGTRPVDVIAVDSRYGSGCTRVGLRRRRVLVLGLPLWETLTTDQRLALLGHDLGCVSAEETLSAAWIRTALDALIAWADVLRPGDAQDAARRDAMDGSPFDVGSSAGNRQSNTVRIGVALAQPLQEFLSRGALWFHRLLSRLKDRSSGQAEYRADETAARVASAASVDGLLRSLLLRDTALFALERAASGKGDLWEKLRADMASVSDMELERRLRLSELRGDASDNGPPTCLRMQFVRKLSSADATVTVSSTESETIAAELLPVRDAIAEELRH